MHQYPHKPLRQPFPANPDSIDAMDGTSGHKIDKLKGTANWSKFEYEMKAVWVIDGVWDVVQGRKTRPVEPKKPEKTTINTADPTGSTYNVRLNEWEKLQEDWVDNTEKWETKNDKAMARLVFCTDDGPRQHIKTLLTCHEQWTMLKKIYGVSDLVTRDLALSKIARMESASYKGIQEYSKAIKKQNTILNNMGCGLPAWILSAFFRMGLEEGLKPYTFQLIQAAKAAGKELEIDDIVKLSEESAKVLAAKFGKQDKANQDKKKKKKSEKSDKKCTHARSKDTLKIDVSI